MRNPNRMWKKILPVIASILLSSTSTSTNYKRKRSTGSSLGFVVVVNAYISSTSNSGSTVPIDRQIKWLRQITNDLVQTNIGQLSTRQLSQTRELMHELAHNPKLTTNYCGIHDNECAITIESLLRRVVAEQKNTASTVASKKKQSKVVPNEFRSILTIQNNNNNNNYNSNFGGFDLQQSSTIELTVDDYNCVLEGWAKSPSASIKTAERCEQILNGMIENGPYPNHQSFTTCINAWKHAMDNNNKEKNHRQYNTIDKQYTNKNPDQQQQQPKVDIRTVAPQRAQRLLELMIRSYDRNSLERSSILPNSANCFDSVLKMWSRSTNNPSAPYEAELLIAIMDKISRTLDIEELRPKRTSLHYVMTTWVNSKQQQHDTTDDTTTTSSSSLENSAPYRVASILDFMNQRATQLGEADIAPNGVSYNIALNSFIHQSDPEHLLWAATKASSYVNQIVSNYKNQTTDTDTTSVLPVVVPDTILFNTAMGLWGKAKKHFASSKGSSRRSIQSFHKARQILNDQIDLYENYNCIQCKPDVFGFTTVIGCCSAVKYPLEQQEAFDIAYETFTQLRDMSTSSQHNDFGKHLCANHITYGGMLKACARLLPIDSNVRRDVVSKVFTECKENGHVSDLVLSWLRDATISMDEYNELLQGYTRKTIPYSWSVNVQDNKRRQNSNK